MIKHTRYRVSWRGKLILQVYEAWDEGGHQFGLWRDARVEDLLEAHRKQVLLEAADQIEYLQGSEQINPADELRRMAEGEN